MCQLRQPPIVLEAAVIIVKVFGIRHVINEEIQEIFFGCIHEFAVGVAPLAVVLIEETVRLPADVQIVVQGHAAALAVELSGASEQCVDRYVELAGKYLQSLVIGLGLACLPTAYGLPSYQNSFSKLLLA